MFMDYYQLVATSSLFIQIVVLILLIGGYWLKRMKKFRQHGITMLTAVVLHTVMILAWMMPSFSSLLGSSVSINLADMIVVTILVHAFMGIAADLLGIWLVASWRLRADMKTCFAKKSIMRVTITLWLIALVLGIILYLKIIQLF
jgi:uncharacterized membrane protein YozB (DUF420 family)